MKNKFEKLLKTVRKRETLIIGNETFLNKCIQCSIPDTLTFLKLTLKKLTLWGVLLENYKFKNYKFNDIILGKCEF